MHQLADCGVGFTQTLRGFVANEAADEKLLAFLVDNGATDVKEALDPYNIDEIEMKRRHSLPAGGFREWTSAMTDQRRKLLDLILQHFPGFRLTTEAATALGEATKTNDMTLLAVLVNRGMSVNCVGSQGLSPLQFAIVGRDAGESLDWILSHGPDLEQKAKPRGTWRTLNCGQTACKSCLDSATYNKADWR